MCINAVQDNKANRMIVIAFALYYLLSFSMLMSCFCLLSMLILRIQQYNGIADGLPALFISFWLAIIFAFPVSLILMHASSKQHK